MFYEQLEECVKYLLMAAAGFCVLK